MPRPILILLQAIIIITTPMVLILGSVRLAMTETVMKMEYQRAGFPPDNYGFSVEDRIEYGAYGIRYLLNSADISYLGDLQIDGKPAFNKRELDHMEDVKVVTRAAMRILLLVASLMAMAVILLLRRPATRFLVFRSWQRGAIFTLVSALAIVALIFINWDTFFTEFHGLFFADGSWQFYRTDTLIRLYPEQFWIDLSLFIAVLTVLGAGLCIISPWLWAKFEHRQEPIPNIAE
jgi:integral membrane protein (TIGR01906 family)